MTLLLSGLLLWVVIHLQKAVAADFRNTMIAKTGLTGWKIGVAVVVVTSLVFIVIGWKSTAPSYIYNPPGWSRHATMALMPLALILFFSARLPSNLRRIVRHPQLSGVKLWAVAHLLSNGDSRSIILFGTMLAWAVLEVIFINKRDGLWQKPEKLPVVKDIILVVFALVVTGVIVHFHQHLAGVALIAPQ